MDENRRWQWRNVPVPEPHLILMVGGVMLNSLRRLPIASRGSWRRLGGTFIIVGLMLAAWATWTAGRIDLERPNQLVTEGPYAASRHPMYVAWTLIYLGVALSFNIAWLLILLPPLLVLTHREARSEESRLEDTFGEVYRTYARRVRRYG